MGNNSSFIRKSQKDSSKRVPTNRLADSDDDDDETDDVLRDSIIQLEVETYECLNGQSEAEVINCLAKSCNSDHHKYIPVEDLFKNVDENASLQILPEAIRHESVLEYIKILEKLVVRIRTSVRGETGEELSFATGCVDLTSDKLVKNGNCRLRNCKYNEGQIHENYGGLVVYTNNHVIKNNLEADCCNVDFFYYNDKSLVDVDVMTDGGSFLLESGDTISPSTEVDNSDHFINMYSSRLHRGITAYGSSLRENQKNKDLVGLRIFYHDPELFNLIKTLSSLRMNALSKIPEEVKRKMKKYAIIISHPHGWPKRISFGDLLSLEETSRGQQGIKMTTYNATTCGGSSGAPVVTGNYLYRPFIHTGKDILTKLGISFSY